MEAVAFRQGAIAAAFPLTLSDRMVQSTEAQFILDPFMGSGTTALSAIRYGRDFTGIEQSPEYVAMANHRIEGYRAALLRCAA